MYTISRCVHFYAWSCTHGKHVAQVHTYPVLLQGGMVALELLVCAVQLQVQAF